MRMADKPKPKPGRTTRPPRAKRARGKRARPSGGPADAGTEGWLLPDRLAEVLSVDPAIIAGHVADGAPVDEAGRLHVIEYAAWLIEGASRARPRPGTTDTD